MLSHAAKQMGGYGWAFGLHEALDQFGALMGPLAIAGILAVRHGGYRLAFAVRAVPAAIMLGILAVARLLYPRPEEMETHPPEVRTEGLPRVYWIYLAGAVLVALGFADFPLIAFHFHWESTVSPALIPIFYATAMGVSGLGSLLFGRLFDRIGIGVLVPLTIVSALFAPLVFLGGFWPALVGVSLWGLGILCAPHHRSPWPVHGGLRDLLVSRERGDRWPLHLVAGRRGGLLDGLRAGGRPAVPAGQAAAQNGHPMSRGRVSPSRGGA